MSKFVASKASKYLNEDGDYVVSFIVKDTEKMFVNLAFEEQGAIKNRIENKLESEFKPYRSLRSKEQNKALWFLLTKLCFYINGVTDKTATEELYCQILEDANIKFDYLLALPETENSLRRSYRAIRKVAEREYNGKLFNMYQYFEGSSKYDPKEMNLLLDCILRRFDFLEIYDSEVEVFRNKYEKQKK